MQIIQNDYGVTLIEQLAALLLGTIIITALFAFYRTELFHLLTQETRMATLEDARGAMDIITRDLKLAGSWGTGSEPSETGVGDEYADQRRPRPRAAARPAGIHDRLLRQADVGYALRDRKSVV